ncbi:MAG: peptidyl-prolyl cis-trans isomerase [Kiritimatiellae bacterium]|nr:peptidyl-prolyl cis-trans isomerase [Kiritimatiellia bacterium]
MSDELNLSLPERKPPPAERRARLVPVLLVLVLLAQGAGLFLLLKGGAGGRPATARAAGLGPEARKDLALKLEKQGLHLQAAEAWQEYLAAARPAAAEAAKIWYRVGKRYQDANQFEKALSAYYRSESHAKLENQLEAEIGRNIQTCLEELGRFAALRYELAERVGLKADTASTGEDVVAEIGARKITKAELDRLIEQQIEREMAQFAAYLPDAERRKRKEALLKQYSTASQRLLFLKQFIAAEVLYRRARESKLADKPDVRDLLKEAERAILSREVIENEVAHRIQITPGDLETYYEAHKKEYAQPERARISHILVKDEVAAGKVMERLKDGASFESLAKELSADPDTAGKGGELDGWAEKDGFMPGLGYAEGASEPLFATPAGAVADKPVKTEKGWHVVKVLKKEPQRQKAFEDVQKEVYRALRARKEREVQEQLLKGLQEQYDVVIHFSTFADNEQTLKAGDSATVP